MKCVGKRCRDNITRTQNVFLSSLNYSKFSKKLKVRVIEECDRKPLSREDEIRRPDGASLKNPYWKQRGGRQQESPGASRRGGIRLPNGKLKCTSVAWFALGPMCLWYIKGVTLVSSWKNNLMTACDIWCWYYLTSILFPFIQGWQWWNSFFRILLVLDCWNLGLDFQPSDLNSISKRSLGFSFHSS